MAQTDETTTSLSMALVLFSNYTKYANGGTTIMIPQQPLLFFFVLWKIVHNNIVEPSLQDDHVILWHLINYHLYLLYQYHIQFKRTPRFKRRVSENILRLNRYN